MKIAFNTEIPQTKNIEGLPFMATLGAHELNLVGVLVLRGQTIAYDAFVSQDGGRVTGTFLKDGKPAKGLSTKDGSVVDTVDGGTPWWDAAPKNEQELVEAYLALLTQKVLKTVPKNIKAGAETQSNLAAL